MTGPFHLIKFLFLHLHKVSHFFSSILSDIRSIPDEIYEEVNPLVKSVLDGYNACILAYGATRSGKTFTMEGSPQNPGLNLRIMTDLLKLSQVSRSDQNLFFLFIFFNFRFADRFWLIKKKERIAQGTFEIGIQVSVFEIYNEQIRDLLWQPTAKGQHPPKYQQNHATLIPNI